MRAIAVGATGSRAIGAGGLTGAVGVTELGTEVGAGFRAIASACTCTTVTWGRVTGRIVAGGVTVDVLDAVGVVGVTVAVGVVEMTGVAAVVTLVAIAGAAGFPWAELAGRLVSTLDISAWGLAEGAGVGRENASSNRCDRACPRGEIATTMPR